MPAQWRPKHFVGVLAEERRRKAERAVALASRVLGGGEELDPQLHAALRARCSLEDVSLGPLRFLRRITLQEPAFTEVVVLYRETVRSASRFAFRCGLCDMPPRFGALRKCQERAGGASERVEL